MQEVSDNAMMQDAEESACLGKIEDHYLIPLRQHLQALLFQY